MNAHDHFYWRWTPDDGKYHCYTRSPKTFVSLCKIHQLPQIGGQKIGRPFSDQRCQACNEGEMEAKGWTKPGPGPGGPIP